jgi:hypothetical protein
MHGFFGKNYRKNLTPKITRLINTSYLQEFEIGKIKLVFEFYSRFSYLACSFFNNIYFY